MASLFEQPRNAGTLFLGGTKISGADIRDQNGFHIQASMPDASSLIKSQSLLHKLSRTWSKALLVHQDWTR